MDRTQPGGISEIDARADALMQSATISIPDGRLTEAAAALEEAARLHAQVGRAYDEARCLQLAASLRRMSGDTTGALALAGRAAAASPDDLPLTVSIFAETAESSFVEGRYADAERAWTQAIETGRRGHLGDDGRSALLRRRAATRLAMNRVQDANADFDEAWGILHPKHGSDMAGFVRTEQADQLLRAGHATQAQHVLHDLEAEFAGRSMSPHLSAEFHLQKARLSRSAHRPDLTVDHARRAREAALEAVAPVSYFAAAVELAESLSAQEDREGAYAALATAWATLSDVLGRDGAKSWVKPVLLAFKIRWGADVFDQAKSSYETQRRAALAAAASHPAMGSA